MTGLLPHSLTPPNSREDVQIPTGNTILPGYTKKPDDVVQALPFGDGHGGISKTTTPLFSSGDEESLASLPLQDEDSCLYKMQEVYKKSPLRASGLQGVVKLQITLEVDGRISDIKVLTSSGKEFSNLAIGVLRFSKECFFIKPARDKQGRVVRFILSPYTVWFTLGSSS